MSSDSSNVFEAAANGDLKFLEKNVKQLNEKNERGWTPLHFAARFGHFQVVKFLKENKVDLTHINNEGKTASQVAAFWGYDQIASIIAPAVKKTNTTLSSSPYPDNYTSIFSGNPLNRFGWNRGKPEFLAPLARSPKSNYIVLNKLQALYDTEGNIHYIKYDQIASIVDRVFTENEFNKTNTDTILVFMGIDEREGKGIDGQPFWALDLTPKGKNEAEYIKLIQGFESKSLEFAPTLPRAFIMDKTISSMIAQAAAMVDWNSRNVFCSACGKRTVLEEAGHKRSCISDPEEEIKCISHTGVQNFTYPRTDAVVIVCIVHPNGDKILLGRNKRWPRKTFSCLSGFVEAAETIEEAVRREAFEEAGIIIDRVAYHSSQPWPFPNSLMLGFLAEASSTEVNTEFDKELEAAVWFTRSEVIAALNGEPNTVFNMVPKGSLAYTLVESWINDKKWYSTNAKI